MYICFTQCKQSKVLFIKKKNMYQIKKEKPPVKANITASLKALSAGEHCLVFDLKQRLSVANTMTRLKKQGYEFTAKVDGLTVKVWRVQ